MLDNDVDGSFIIVWRMNWEHATILDDNGRYIIVCRNDLEAYNSAG